MLSGDPRAAIEIAVSDPEKRGRSRDPIGQGQDELKRVSDGLEKYVGLSDAAARFVSYAFSPVQVASAEESKGYTLTIHVVHGGGSSGAVGSSLKGWGHAFFSITAPSGYGRSYGWWPGGEGAGKESIDGRSYPGVLSRTDHLTYPNADIVHTQNITKAQVGMLVNYAKAYENTHAWSIDDNCTDFVLGASQKVGINVPRSARTFGKSDPNKLEDAFKSKN